jgi:hypothetical protein
MLMVRCRVCGTEHEAGYGNPRDFPFCDHVCAGRFERIVELLSTDAPLEIVGVEEGSRLWREAMQEVSLREARERWQGRAQLEIDYYASLPRRLPSLWRRYCGY